MWRHMDSKLCFLCTICAMCLGYQMIVYFGNNLSSPRFMHLKFTNGGLSALNLVHKTVHHPQNNTKPVKKEEVHLKYQADLNENFESIATTEVYVKTAIFDNRPGQAARQVVKIWALCPMKEINLFCHVNYGKNIIKVIKAQILIQSDTVVPSCNWLTAVIDCPLQLKKPPVKVSISASKTRTNSWHKVLIRLFKPPVTPRYGICLTTVFDITTRMKLHSLVEWFEMQKLLGVHNVMLYGIHNVSVSTLKVLKHYIDSGFLIYHPLRLPLPSYTPLQLVANPSLKSVNGCISYYAQHLNYMDCIYRYVDDFTYLALIDTDDYIIPQQGYTWHDMFKNIEKLNQSQNTASYLIQRSFFPVYKNYVQTKNWTIFLRTKSIIRRKHPEPRSKNLKDSDLLIDDYRYFKSVVRPSSINYFHIHRVLAAISGWMPRRIVPLNIGRCCHYQLHSFIPSITVGLYANKNLAVKDKTMFKYYKRLTEEIVNTLQKTIKLPSLNTKLIQKFFNEELEYRSCQQNNTCR